MKPQCAEILDYLRRHGSITQLEALTRLGCMRLGARIWDLKRDGIRIDSAVEKDGEKHYARYYLREVKA